MSTIFLLERDPDIRFVMDYWLYEAGYTIYSFASKALLTEALGNLVPDIILLDAYPITFGGDNMLCKELKTRYSFPNKILLVSTSAIKEEDLVHYGADGVIHKPFDLNELSHTLQAAL